MYNHYVFDILDTFNQKELKKFKDFIGSFFFNKRKFILPLYKKIMDAYSETPQKELDKEDLCKIVSPTSNESTLRDSLSILLKLLEQFIVVEKILRDKDKYYDIILNYYSDKKLRNLFDHKYKQCLEYYNKFKPDNNILGTKTSLGLIKLNDLESNYEYNNPDVSKYFFDSISKVFGYLVNNFVTQTTILYNNTFVSGSTFNLKLENNPVKEFLNTGILDSIIDFYKPYNEYNYFMEIYSALQSLYRENSDNSYDVYKKSIIKYSDKISKFEFGFHHIQLSRYCRNKLLNDSGSVKYIKEIFNLNVLFLENELYIRFEGEKYFSEMMFRKIANDAINAKEFDWCARFIKSYSEKLDPAIRNVILNMCFAHYYLALKIYKKAYEHASQIKGIYITYKIEKYILMIFSLYEIGEQIKCEEISRNFNSFLKRTKSINEEIRNRHKNFLLFFRELIKANTTRKTDNIGYLKKQLTKLPDKSIANKEWLIEKYEKI
jgi:hypothetical protein